MDSIDVPPGSAVLIVDRPAPHTQLTDVSTLTRQQVVPYFVDLIVYGVDEEVKRVTQLILTKWTPAGLVYIKEQAWKALGPVYFVPQTP